MTLMNQMVSKAYGASIEAMIDFDFDDGFHQPFLDGFRALSTLLESRGPLPKTGFFHQTTGLHYKEDKGD
jgi:hypothetical protein